MDTNVSRSAGGRRTWTGVSMIAAVTFARWGGGKVVARQERGICMEPQSCHSLEMREFLHLSSNRSEERGTNKYG